MKILEILKSQFFELIKIQKTAMPTFFPICAGLCMGLPLLVGAYMDLMSVAVIAAIGGMAFLYTPHTPIYHRMIVLMAASFGICISFTLGLLSHFNAIAVGLALGMIATLGAMICRYYQFNKPGNFIFIMVATLGAFMPLQQEKFPYYIGIISLGCFLACVVGLLYSVATIKKVSIEPVIEHRYIGFSEVITDPVIIGIFVGISVFVAEFFGFVRAYWVPISCLTIMQGMTLAGAWMRHIQRNIGTFAGLFLTMLLFYVVQNNYILAFFVGILRFLIEYFAPRNYAIAAFFLTPMTIFLAENSGVIVGDSSVLIFARFIDILMGSSIGVIGGLCLHYKKFRSPIERALKFILLQKNN